MMKYEFWHTDLQRAMIQENIENYPSFKKCFITDLTDAFFADLDNRINGNIPQHIVLFIYGMTGTFKSSVAQSIACHFQPDFKASQIVFTDEKLLAMARLSKPKSFFIRDESPKGYGVGSKRIASQVHLLSETLRKRQNSLIFIRPVWENIGAAHFWLKTIDVTKDQRHVRLGIQNPQTHQFLGCIVVPIVKDNPIWQKYEGVKDQFLEDVATQNLGGTSYSDLAERVSKHKDFKLATRKKQRRVIIAEMFPNMTVMEQDFIFEKSLMIYPM